MIFATPDFGASGVIVLFLLVFWVILFACVLAVVFLGARLRRSGSPRARTLGLWLVLASCSVPFVCCLAPPHLVRLIYGNYPIGSYPSGRINEGMSVDEVEAILGTPHEKNKRDNEETWFYWIDTFGVHYFAVGFGPDRRVVNTYGD